MTQRLRLTFAKTEAMRFTGHLDLHHTWERTLRRAGLPLAYSQGFNPHPRLNLASALPLGFTSECEVIDVWLEQEMSVEEVNAVDPHQPALQSELEASEFILTLLEDCPNLEVRCQSVLQATSLPRVRRGKDYDLRPLILALQTLPPDGEGRQRLILRLAAREGATGRPEEVMAELSIQPEEARTHRTHLIFKN
jgi:hypothetical protein